MKAARNKSAIKKATSRLAAGVASLVAENAAIKLDIGCGGNKQDGFIGIDYRPLKGVDIVHDLEKFPWPLPDESVNIAVCSHVVEHINPTHGLFIDFMNEVWRVMKYDAELAITTPYAGSPGYWQDPTHINGCTEMTFRYFDPLDEPTGGQLYRIYEPAPWRIKFFNMNPVGNLEIVLIKRRDDVSFHQSGEIKYGKKPR